MREAETAALVQQVASTFGLNVSEWTLLRQGRGTVVRAYSRSGQLVGPLIIKVFQPAHRPQFERERAGLELLSSVGKLDGVVPRLLGEDEETLTLLIAEIPEQASYAELIASPFTDAAESVLTDTAQRLGLLHGHARSLVPEFNAMVREHPTPGLHLNNNVDATCAFLQSAFARIASDIPSAEFSHGSDVHAELLKVAEDVDKPSALSTITVGDMAPSNILLGPHGPIFIDFEYCAVRQPFYDAMFWHCIYPLPEHIADQMDTAYHQGLSAAGLPIDQGEFRQAMFLFMAHRLFWTLSWNMEPLLERDREIVPGVSMRTTLQAYLQEYTRFATHIERHQEVLPAIAARLGEGLARLWPE